MFKGGISVIFTEREAGDRVESQVTKLYMLCICLLHLTLSKALQSLSIPYILKVLESLSS